jgi:hypothetical protein
MGSSNLTKSFERRYATLLGERTMLQADLDRIRRQMKRVPDIEAQIAKIEPLLKSVTMLILNLKPDWEPFSVPKKRPLKFASPFPYGTCSRRALSVLRGADEPLTVRQIALIILADIGIERPDPTVTQQTINTIDSAFHHHKGKTIECCGRNPAQWRSIGKPILFTD